MAGTLAQTDLPGAGFPPRLNEMTARKFLNYGAGESAPKVPTQSERCVISHVVYNELFEGAERSPERRSCCGKFVIAMSYISSVF
jgi:hypothetical protein